MKEENEEGHFDGAGNFVWRKEEQAVQEDAWLENVSNADMNKALQAQKVLCTNVVFVGMRDNLFVDGCSGSAHGDRGDDPGQSPINLV